MIKRIKVPFKEALLMLYGYAKSRIMEQIKSVAFIILYLVVFQMLILGVPLANALGTAGGIALVVFGLAFFLEGLMLGLMPLGERVGVKLPTKVGIITIAIFGIILGFGATLAEPAISALKLAGSSVTAWDSPLLFLLLNKYSGILVTSVGVGVGIAVALGMFRFYYNMSMKPFIFIIIPILLVITTFVAFDANLVKIIGLAWDCGAVTTGAVTVPLVLALGIGVSRAASKGKSTSGGFGVIMMASAFPILAVLLLGIFVNFNTPKATTETEFFSVANRAKALNLFENENELYKHAFTLGSESGRKSCFANDDEYKAALLSMSEKPKVREAFLGSMSLSAWIINCASVAESKLLSNVPLIKASLSDEAVPLNIVLKEEAIGGARAVIPLTLLLLLVLLVFLKEKLRYRDEVALGIAFTLIGMILLTMGIRLGLASLGKEVGAQLPRAFATEEKYLDKMYINNFDSTLVYNTISTDGVQKAYFNINEDGKMKPVEFHRDRFDVANNRYEHIITQAPMFDKRLTILGIVLVLIFGFGMGYGATLAEPALNALGITVEELTVGNIKRSQIVQVVSVGVGTGIVLGLSRILFDIPLAWLLIPSYIILIPLTILSDDEFSAIAWDSGGVTTGPVTVPLVLAMGLSIGSELNIADGFGVLALASAYPIITVLLFGLMAKARQKKAVLTSQKDEENE